MQMMRLKVFVMSGNTQLKRCFETGVSLFKKTLATLITVLIIGSAGGLATGAQAADLKLAWDNVADSRVDGYQIHYGPASGQYETQVATASTATTVTGLAPGQTYYFAARACAADGATCSGFSNEVSTTIPNVAPVAAFAADVVSGTAPVTAHFADQSTGQISGWAWNFGDGTSASVQSPQHTFTNPGTYSVSLTVTGPGGTNSVTKTGYIQVLPPRPSRTSRSACAPASRP